MIFVNIVQLQIACNHILEYWQNDAHMQCISKSDNPSKDIVMPTAPLKANPRLQGHFHIVAFKQ